MDRDGVEHVDAWEDVGGGIRLVDQGYQPGTEILLRVHSRPHIGTVGNQGADQQA